MALDYGAIDKIDAPVARILVPEDDAVDRVIIADAQFLFSAKFKKSGADLVLTGEDGKKLVLADYFSHSRLPDLATPGGAFLSGDLVERLAGPEHPGQYAQAGAPAGVPVVGRVERVGGTATVQHSNGVTEELKIGDNILQGDVVETRDGSTLGLSFIDGAAFNMGAGARMSINELVYDANSNANSAVFSIVKGAISFVAGQAARTGDMRVETPVATMGIRGTTVSSNTVIDTSNAVCTAAVDPTTMPETCIVSFSAGLITDPDGHVGGFNLINRLTNTLVNSVTTTDSTVTIIPIAGVLTSQVSTKTPQQVAQDLNTAQILFPMFLSNPVNSSTTNQPQQDIRPQGPADHGSSTPPGNTTVALDTSTPLILQVQTNETGITSNITNNNNSAPPPPKNDQPLPITKFAPTVLADSPPNLVEAVHPAGPGDPGNPGIATSVAHITKADVDGTVAYDTAGWQDLGGGIFSQGGTYGKAYLDTGANTLTYQLDNAKADPLGPGDHPTESFVINVVDNDSLKASTTISFTVDGRNDPPALSVPVQDVSLDKNTFVDITGIHVSDPEPADDVVTTFHVTHGTLTPLANGNFAGAGTDTVTFHTTQALDAAIAAGLRYTPSANYAGADDLVIDVSDGHGGVQHQDVAINVILTGAPVTDAAVAQGNEDQNLSVTLSGSDSNGSLTAFRIVSTAGLAGLLFSDASHTQLIHDGDLVPVSGGNSATVYFAPAQNFNGQTSFTFAAHDDTGVDDPAPATATITLDPVNDPPFAQNGVADVTENQQFVGQASAVDIDSPALTLQLAGNNGGAAHGAVVMDVNGQYTYTPDANFFGTDAFFFTAFDGSATSNVGRIDVTVTHVNQPPDTFNVINNNGIEDFPEAVVLSGVDNDGTITGYRIVSLSGLHGTLYADQNLTQQLHEGDIVTADFTQQAVAFIKPDANFNGGMSFTFAAVDDQGGQDASPATATVNFAPVNDAPVANDDGPYLVNENQQLIVAVGQGVLANDTDVENDPLSALVGSTTQHGTLAMAADGSFTYTPDAGFSGTDQFSYHAFDGQAVSNLATVSIDVGFVNQPPDTSDTFSAGLEDNTIAVSLGGSDPDGAVQSFRITDTTGLHGFLYSDSSLAHFLQAGDTVSVGSVGTASVYFRPDQDSSGTSQFKFAAIDNAGAQDPTPATAIIDVTPVNDAPVIIGTSAGLTYLPGGPPVAVASNVLVGDVDNANFGGGSLTATITQGGQQGDILSIVDNAFISLNGTAVMFDADGSGGAFIPAVIGSWADNLNSLEIDLNANADASAVEALTQAIAFQNTMPTPTSDLRTVTFTLVDGGGTANGGQDTGQFDATVSSATGTNHAPVSNDDFYTTPENVTLNVSVPGVLANDTDAENDPLFAFELAGPSHGTLTLMPDGSFFYSPDQGFVGTDTFTYAAFDSFSHGNPVISGNLIVNPDAELGPAASDFGTSVAPQGWTATGGFTAITYAAGASDPVFLNAADSAALATFGSQDGGLAYFAGGPNNATSSITQIIDVSNYGADIDLGLVQAILSADIGGYTGQEDNIVLTAHYLATANATSDLGHTIITGPTDQLRHDYATGLALPDATLLMPEGGVDVLPVGTRFIEIELTSTRASGSYNDGYADNLSLQLFDFASTGNVATVTIDVTGSVNTPPAVALSATLLETNEDTSIDLSASVTDPDAGDILTATITAAHGALTLLGNLGAGSGITPVDIDGSDGTLIIQGSADAINAAIATGVTYTPGHDYNNTLANPDHITFSVSDNHGGSDSQSADIIVYPVNDAPVLADDAPALIPITSNNVNNSGQTVASFLGADVTDPDGPGTGIAVSGATSVHGHWEYQLNGSGFWRAFSASDTNALLLSDADLIRFVPNPGSGGTDSITYHAWDQSDGLAPSETVDLTGNVGGASAYSVDADTASITVTVPPNSPPTVELVGTFDLVEQGVDSGNNPVGISSRQLTLNVSDPDGDTVSFDPTGWFQSGSVFSQQGTFGSLQYDSNEAGMLSYQLNDNSPVAQSLKAGQQVTDQFDITFIDQQGAPTTEHVVVNITGSNDAPVTQGDETVAFDSNDVVPFDLRIALPTDYEKDAMTVQIASVPAVAFGSILLDGNAIAAGAVLTVDQLARLQFQSASPGNSGQASTLSYTVADTNGGATTNTITFSNSGVAAQSATLNFDDPNLPQTTTSLLQIPSGYGALSGFAGFAWNGVGVIARPPVSSPDVAWGTAATISSLDGTEFNINSFEIGPFDAHSVLITGFDFNAQVGQLFVDFTDSSWHLITPNFGPITQLTIQGLGNTLQPEWKMDDFSFTTVHDLLGGFGNDVLIGDAVDDRFHGGFGNDTFVYATGGKADTILDFAQGQDRISLQGVAGVHSMADIGPLASQQGADTFIVFGNGDTLTLKNVNLNALSDGDFLFSPGITGDLSIQLVKGGTVAITTQDLQGFEGGNPDLTFTVAHVEHGHLVRTDTSQTLAVGAQFTEAELEQGIIAFATDDTVYTGTGAGFSVSLSDGVAGSQPATATVFASVFDAQLTVHTNDGLDFNTEDPVAKMGAGVLTPDNGNPSNTFRIAYHSPVDPSADRDFTVIGSGFTYSGGVVTGGVITAIIEVDHATQAQMLNVDLDVPAVDWMNAAFAKAAGDNGPMNALTNAWALNFIGGGGGDAFDTDNNQDLFTGGPGDDTFIGEGSLDRASYSHATGPITVNLADGIVTGDTSVGTDTLRSIELVTGTAFDDTFDATGFNSTTSLNLGSGSSSGVNTNEFEGRGGDDAITGNGSTRVSYLHATGPVTVDLQNPTAGLPGSTGTADGDASTGHDTFFGGVNQVRGTAYGDTLLGSDNPSGTFENFDGRGGNDFIDGRGGFDRVIYLFDGPQADGVTGVQVNLGVGTVVGGFDTGTDTLRSIEGIIGTNFNDAYDASTFTASNAPSPSINSGNAGPNDSGSPFNEFEGAGGDDTVIGNGSTRVAFYNATDGVVVTLGSGGSGTAVGASSGHDTYISGVNQVRGSEFNDIITGNGGANTLDGRSGNDVLDGSAGSDTLTGGTGADIFAFTPGALGNDIITDFDRSGGVFNHAEGDRIDLRAFNTNFTTLQPNITSANGGNDTLITFAAGNTVTLTGVHSTDLTAGDFIFAPGGAKTVAVTVNSDGYDFGTLYDDLAASNAQQTQNTTTHLYAVDAAKGITFEMIAASGTAFVLGANHLPINGSTAPIGEIDILNTTDLNDSTLLTQSHVLVSTTGWNLSTGSLFSDIAIYAADHTQTSGLDILFGSATYSAVGSSGLNFGNGIGQDIFFAGNHADFFNGLGSNSGPFGLDNDTVDYSHATTGVTVDLSNPANNLGIAAAGDTYINIGNIRGSAHNDVLTGDGTNNVLEGGLGTNTLDGGGGSNTASYEHAASAVTVSLANADAQNTLGAGTDTLTNIQNLLGSAFGDHLTGDGNANILIGAHGDDALTGGLGNDTFVFVGGDGHDTITDFTVGQDKIDLTNGQSAAQVQALIDATAVGTHDLVLTDVTITMAGVDVHGLHVGTDVLVH